MVSFRPVPPGVAAASLALALTACATAPAPTGSTVPPPITPTVAPTFSCTPTFGGAAYPCGRTEHEQLAATAKKYEDAAALYDKLNYHLETLAAQRKPIDDEVRSMAAGEFLDQVTESQKEFESGRIKVSGHSETKWARPLRKAQLGSYLALRMCSAPATLKIVTAGEVVAPIHLESSAFFDHVGGPSLRLIRLTSKKVSSC